MAKLHVYIAGLLLLTMGAIAKECFPLKKLFGHSPHWVQSISMNSRFRLELDFKKKSEMVFITETDKLSSLTRDKYHMFCLESPVKGRYLVQVDHDVGNKHTRFRCVQFNRLAKHVIRISRTPESKTKNKVNCETDTFVEDSAVLVAYGDIHTHNCPLSGGYQLIMEQGMSNNGACKKSVRTYDPRIQFMCDRKEAGRVVADFGEDCKPPALKDVLPVMKTRNIAHLRCVASWEENKGQKNGFSSILLNLRDYPKSFWCLHYKLKPHDLPDTTSYDGEEIYEASLSMDGRCSGETFVNGDVPRNSSMFGYLASYRPEDDMKCTERVYLQTCDKMPERCFDSSDCPGKCQRCKDTFVTEKCEFDADSQGRWSLVNSKRSLKIRVDGDKLTSSTFGRMYCRAMAGVGQGSDLVFPVVQSGVASTCKPYYACARVHSPAPGVLDFHLRPASRDSDTGLPNSCRQMYRATRQTRPPTAEQTVTLLNPEKMKRTPCQFPHQMTFRTSSPCMIVVKQCSDDCDTLSTYLDTASCGNETMWPHKIDKKHRCYAKFDFLDGNFGLLTQSLRSGRYVCWIVTSNRLFIASPEMCNQESVTRGVMGQMDAGTRYDPLMGLSKSFSEAKIGTDNNGASSRAVGAIALCLLGVVLSIVR